MIYRYSHFDSPQNILSNNPTPQISLSPWKQSLPSLICHLLHQVVHVTLRRAERGGVAHCGVHHLGLHIQVLKLLLKSVHQLWHLSIKSRSKGQISPNDCVLYKILLPRSCNRITVYYIIYPYLFLSNVLAMPCFKFVQTNIISNINKIIFHLNFTHCTHKFPHWWQGKRNFHYKEYWHVRLIYVKKPIGNFHINNTLCNT